MYEHEKDTIWLIRQQKRRIEEEYYIWILRNQLYIFISKINKKF